MEISEKSPSANRIRIAFFGRRNAGKSSLINALTAQNLAIVSDVPGTTTDPVSKAMELLPLGPCIVTDTAGLDDEGELGELRIKKSLAVLDVADIAVLAVPCAMEEGAVEARVREICRKRSIALVVVRTKADEHPDFKTGENEVLVSSVTGLGVDALRDRIAAASPQEQPPRLVADLASRGDIVICVCPIDEAAPKGRLILPQQQVIRELLEIGAAAFVCQPQKLKDYVAKLGEKNIRFVITDSQAFGDVRDILPRSVPLTSFSILFARQKGDLKTLCEGAAHIKNLEDGDRVLIAEGCTHRRQCGDIGSVKIPRWLEKYTGKRLEFTFASGGDFPIDGDSPPKLVVHCGGCMLTRRAVMARLFKCAELGIPVVNYGVAIGLMHGIVANPETCMVER